MNSAEVSVAGVDPPSWLRRCAGFVKKVLKARSIRDWEVSVLLCDDSTIRSLNRRYRELDEPTDVLAFGQQEGAAVYSPPDAARRAAGDVVISLETTRRNAASRGVPEEEELKRLLIHGILHLEGLDHPEAEAEMFEIQERILAQLKKERVF